MDLSPAPDQSAIKHALESVLAKECPPDRVRRSESTGFDAALWDTLVDVGVVDLTDADCRTLCSALEVVGRFLAPCPVAEVLTARRLLSDEDLGSDIVTLAPRPASDGRWPLVPAGSLARWVVGVSGGELVLSGPVDDLPPPEPNLGSMPLADRAVVNPRVLGDASLLDLSEWRLLNAAALLGLGRRALELAVEYVKVRHQFGVPIGSFQAVAHALADAATALDGLDLLVAEAAWATDENSPRAAALSTMALVFAAETVQSATATALHVHGGYGFTMEYDVQLYFRRAKAWALVAGDPAAELRVLADQMYGRVG